MKEEEGKFKFEVICGSRVELILGRSKDLSPCKASSQTKPKSFYVYAHRDRKEDKIFILARERDGGRGIQIETRSGVATLNIWTINMML
jgi:hypothetical protein